MSLTPEEKKQQEYYRDARTGGYYGDIWTTVGKCVFCDMRDKYIVHEENGIVLTIALFAYIDGNLMIVPRRHIKSVKDLTDKEWATIRKFMYIAKKIIRRVHGHKDIQYVLRDGGLAVNSTVQDHMHMHCIPSDGPDMTVWNYRQLKHTPLENAELFQKQREKIRKLGDRFDKKYRNEHEL
ncbi:MAG TPA: HIT domain-containing protein [Candidatus Pristimantibacillus sp.]|jgi:diadenosine tetraphosphate (Ap4A) HIT family hydrolase|nr:HIT domain-containing protein [Candidatus Pristimantibacillus sp.]